MQTVKIFLSSPGDCQAERDAVHQLAGRLSSNHVVAMHARLEIVAWDWGVGIPLDALRSPQGSVNEHLRVPEACNVFIGVFRCRFGTPLPADEFRKENGQPFLSGSEYEFHRAWRARRNGRNYPHILMYRCEDVGSGDRADSDQIERLNAFFNAPPFHDGTTWTGSVHRFRHTDDFITQLKEHLELYLSRLMPGAKPPLPEWCKQHASKLSKNAGPRYTADAHVETSIGKVFDWLLTRTKAIEELDEGLAVVWKALPVEPAFQESRDRLAKAAEGLRSDPLWRQLPDFTAILQVLQDIEDLAWEELERAEGTEKENKTSSSENHRQSTLRRSGDKSRDIGELIREFSPLARKRALLLTGPAGQGKTHTLVREVHRAVEMGGFAIGVLGQELSGTGNLWTELLQSFDYASSVSEFLDKLEGEAAQLDQRVLLVFDALNETRERARWRHQLLGMLHEILKRPHLTVALSVRADYLQQVLPPIADGDEPPWVKWEHPGFAGMEPDALIRYFSHFGVKAPIAPPIGELGNPLYVQLLAKSLQNRREPTHWLPSWVEVWEAWVDRLERDASGRLTLDPSRKSPVRRILEKLSQQMLEVDASFVPREKADEIARGVSGTDGVIGFLCSAGALMDRIDSRKEEVVDFAYERLTDTFLADTLLNNLFSGLSTPEEKRAAFTSSILPTGKFHPLVSDKWIDSPIYRRRSGLLRALCLMLPRHVHCELPTLLSDYIDQYDWQLADAFTDSLRWRSNPDEFGADTQTLLQLWEHWGPRLRRRIGAR